MPRKMNDDRYAAPGASSAQRRRRQRRAPIPRLRQQHLHGAELALEEAALAVTEVVLPEPHETVGIAELAHLAQIPEEPLAPRAQRARVVRADVFEMEQLEVGGARHRLEQRRHR